MTRRLYARGKYAYGFCDRCDVRWPLDDLRSEYINGIKRNNRICPLCWDEDHPQNFIDKVDPHDPEALRDPRPDRGLDDSRTLIGTWDPSKYL